MLGLLNDFVDLADWFFGLITELGCFFVGLDVVDEQLMVGYQAGDESRIIDPFDRCWYIRRDLYFIQLHQLFAANFYYLTTPVCTRAYQYFMSIIPYQLPYTILMELPLTVCSLTAHEVLCLPFPYHPLRPTCHQYVLAPTDGVDGC